MHALDASVQVQCLDLQQLVLRRLRCVQRPVCAAADLGLIALSVSARGLD